jgi:hypothetical protein
MRLKMKVIYVLALMGCQTVMFVLLNSLNAQEHYIEIQIIRIFSEYTATDFKI